MHNVGSYIVIFVTIKVKSEGRTRETEDERPWLGALEVHLHTPPCTPSRDSQGFHNTRILLS